MLYTVYDLTGLQDVQTAWQRAAAQLQTTAGPILAENTELQPQSWKLDSTQLRQLVKASSLGEQLLTLQPGETAPLLTAGDKTLAVRFDGFRQAETLSDSARSVLQTQLMQQDYAARIEQMAAEMPRRIHTRAARAYLRELL